MQFYQSVFKICCPMYCTMSNVVHNYFMKCWKEWDSLLDGGWSEEIESLHVDIVFMEPLPGFKGGFPVQSGIPLSGSSSPVSLVWFISDSCTYSPLWHFNLSLSVTKPTTCTPSTMCLMPIFQLWAILSTVYSHSQPYWFKTNFYHDFSDFFSHEVCI